MGAGALWEAEEAEGRQPLVRNALPVLSLLQDVEVGCSPPTWGSLLRKKGEWGAVGAGERPWCYPTSEDTRSPPLASSVLRKLRPRAESEGGLDLGVPGAHDSAPPLPEDLGRVRASRAVPPRLTQAQTHLGSRAGSPRRLQRGSRRCGRPVGPTPILVRSRRAPSRARAAPTSRLEPGAPGRPPFPSPPGRPGPVRAPAARLHPGPVRPAGQPFLARPAESQRWPHPPASMPAGTRPATPRSPPRSSDAHFTDRN